MRRIHYLMMGKARVTTLIPGPSPWKGEGSEAGAPSPQRGEGWGEGRDNHA